MDQRIESFLGDVLARIGHASATSPTSECPGGPTGSDDRRGCRDYIGGATASRVSWGPASDCLHTAKKMLPCKAQ